MLFYRFLPPVIPRTWETPSLNYQSHLPNHLQRLLIAPKEGVKTHLTRRQKSDLVRHFWKTNRTFSSFAWRRQNCLSYDLRHFVLLSLSFSSSILKGNPHFNRQELVFLTQIMISKTTDIFKPYRKRIPFFFLSLFPKSLKVTQMPLTLPKFLSKEWLS